MAVNVVLGQAIQFRRIRDFDNVFAVADIAIEHRLFIGQLVVQLLQPGARGVVFVDSRQAKLEELALEVVAGRGIGF